MRLQTTARFMPARQDRTYTTLSSFIQELLSCSSVHDAAQQQTEHQRANMHRLVAGDDRPLVARPVENRWIGQRISEPDIDFASLARSQGAQGFGPVTKGSDLVAIFAQAIAAVERGEVAVVDVRVEPGYAAVTTAAMLRGTEKK